MVLLVAMGKKPHNGAFGNAVLRVVAKGKVSHDFRNKYTEVKVSQVGIYFKDSYDFKGWQYLGCWSLKSPYVAHTSYGLNNPICVWNSSFREHADRQHNNENHGNFRIYSNIEAISTNQTLKFPLESQVYGGGRGGSW